MCRRSAQEPISDRFASRCSCFVRSARTSSNCSTAPQALRASLGSDRQVSLELARSSESNSPARCQKVGPKSPRLPAAFRGLPVGCSVARLAFGPALLTGVDFRLFRAVPIVAYVASSRSRANCCWVESPVSARAPLALPSAAVDLPGREGDSHSPFSSASCVSASSKYRFRARFRVPCSVCRRSRSRPAVR